MQQHFEVEHGELSPCLCRQPLPPDVGMDIACPRQHNLVQAPVQTTTGPTNLAYEAPGGQKELGKRETG